MMTAGDVLGILTVLGRAGVRCWVDGGWGVDALVGTQTRDHDDLDLALEYDHLAAFTAAVAPAGFRELRWDGPANPVYADPADRRIDVHLVDTGGETVGLAGNRVYGPRGLPYEVGALEGQGRIAGTAVPCCTAEYQVRSHTGYAIDADDVHDVLALHRRFGIELPPEYRAPA